MTTFSYADTWSVDGIGGVNGVTVNAYKASRFTGTPGFNAAPPSGGADATATTANADGAPGSFIIALPTSEPYHLSLSSGGDTYWKGPVAGLFMDEAAEGGSSPGGTMSPLLGITGTVDPGASGDNYFDLIFSSSATSAAAALRVRNSSGGVIAEITNAEGWRVFGERNQAAPSTSGPYMALDGTTNPPSILLPSTSYGAGNRIWSFAGTPAAQWVSGTTNVGDLWFNQTNQLWYQCIVSGAGTGPGTWILYGAIVPVNAQTGTTYTAALTDIGQTIEMSNTSANTLTVPPHASVAWPQGATFDVTQVNSGVTTIAAGVGVTINSVGGLVMAEWVTVSLRYRGGDVWLLTGATT